MQIEKRLTAITFLGAIGGVMFVPFAQALVPGANPFTFWLGFPVGAAVVTGLCAWGGLRIADRANLPMPILRPWELGQAADSFERTWMLRVSTAAGGVFGLAMDAARHWFGVPLSPGTLAVRLGTIPFAAVVPETIVHLLLMSAFVWLLKRTWISILLSSLIYVLLLHIRSVGTATMADFAVVFDFLFITLTGWLYGRYGIESAFLTHAVAQAILLGLN